MGANQPVTEEWAVIQAPQGKHYNEEDRRKAAGYILATPRLAKS